MMRSVLGPFVKENTFALFMGLLVSALITVMVWLWMVRCPVWSVNPVSKTSSSRVGVVRVVQVLSRQTCSVGQSLSVVHPCVVESLPQPSARRLDRIIVREVAIT